VTQQPEWKLVGQLGDKHPIEYGGLFVFVDKTGVYRPEAEKLIAPEDHIELEAGKWEVRRFILEDCTYIAGVLSDNKYHKDHPAWFAEDLAKLTSFSGQTKKDLIDMFLSPEPCVRALAWELVGEYWGWDNLDSYPDYYNYEEIKARVKMHGSCKE
jgi:hypothetical protein